MYAPPLIRAWLVVQNNGVLPVLKKDYMKTRRTTRAEKIVNPGIYEVPVAYEINNKIKELAKKAEFVFWKDEAWGPGEGHIDWSSNYDNELNKFAELIVRECALTAGLMEPYDRTGIGAQILDNFGIKE
jgi:hypothetical protein